MKKSLAIIGILVLFFNPLNADCGAHKYLSGSNCYNCWIGCGNCTSVYNCTTCASTTTQENPPTCSCISGYYWSASYCAKCALPCITCTSSTVCTSCMDTVNQSLPYCKCKSNQYQNTLTKVCYDCTSPCATCGTNSSTYCYTCIDGYYDVTGKCYPCTKPCGTCTNMSTTCMSCIDPNQIFDNYSCSCPSSTYLDTTTYFCKNCVSPCSTCSSATNCKTCIDQYILSGTSCLPCTKPCENCSGSQTNCTTCMDKSNQLIPSCSCTLQTQYLDTKTSMCLNCKSPCKTCTSDSYCLSCVDNTYNLAQGSCFQCSQSCQTCSSAITCIDDLNQTPPTCQCTSIHQYIDLVSFKCFECQTPCVTCTSLMYCTECIDQSYLLIDNSCVKCTAPCVTCSESLTTCITCVDKVNQISPTCQCAKANQYLDTDTYYCKECSSSCAACTSADYCTKCIDDQYILIDDACVKCQKPCLTCDQSITNCTSCIDSNNQNTPTCQCAKANQYSDTDTYYCKECSSSCAACTSADYCTKCIDNQYILIDNACVKCQKPCLTCDQSITNCTSCFDYNNQYTPNCQCVKTNQYLDTETYYCKDCRSSCAACTSADYCTKCINDQYILIDNACVKCQTPCLTCTNNTTYCLNCQEGLNRYLYQNKCICNDGYYEQDNICFKCELPCINCVSLTECISCQDQYQELPNCSCRQKYYMDQQFNCQQCHHSCKECESNKCIQCSQTYQLEENNQCICLDGYYDDAVQQYCNKCQLPCTTCQNSASQCTGCLDTNQILIYYQCKCISGYGQNGFNCAPCQKPCKECSESAITCTICINNKMIISSNYCKCNDGYYLNQTQDDCLKCLDNCDICEGNNNCTSCSEGYYYENDKCHKCLNQCKICGNSVFCDECFEGFYFETECKPCKEGCDNCNDSFSCNLCIDGFYLKENDCLKCNEKCKTCLNEPVCTSCLQGSDLIQDQCQCSDGYFEKDLKCQKCQFPCAICENETFCIKCVMLNGLTLNKNGICQCIDGYFWNDNYCSQCDQNCLTCSETSINCLSCPIERQLNQNKCDCLDGYFEFYGTCLPCSTEQGKLEIGCKIKDSSDRVWTYGEQCDDGNNISRDGCSENIIDKNYSCLNVILQKSICYKCQEHCSKCIAEYQCTDCEIGYYLLNNQCTICSNKCLGCSNKTGKCISCRFIKDAKGECQLCEYNAGYYSDYESNKCYSICGDQNFAKGQEECDDGNRSNGDGCDSNCKLEKKFVCQDGICIQPYPTPIITQQGQAQIYNNNRSFNLTYNLDIISISNFDLKSKLSVYIVSKNNINRLLQEEESELTNEEQKQSFDLDYQFYQNENSFYSVSATIKIELQKTSIGEELLIKLRATDNVCTSQGYCQQDTEIRFPIQKYISIDSKTFDQVDSFIAISQTLIIMLIIFGFLTLLFGEIKIFFNFLDVIQILSYLKYINIQYPYNLEALFNFFGFAKLNQLLYLLQFNYSLYFSDPWADLLPQKIQLDGYNSLLLINCTPFILLWIIIIGLYLFSSMGFSQLKQFSVKFDSSENKFQVNLKILLMNFKMFLIQFFLYFKHQLFYNIILRTHISTSFDYCFLIILQLNTYQIRSSSPLASFSSFLFIVAFIIYFGMIFVIINLNSKKYSEIITLKAKNEYGTIFVLTDKQKFHKYILVFTLIKKLLFIFLLIFAYQNTIYQTLGLFCLMLLSSLIILILKPFENPLEYQKQLISEVTLSILFGLIFLLTLNFEIYNYSNDDAFGWCCIATICILLLIQLFYNTLQFWDQLLIKYKAMRQIAYYFNQLLFPDHNMPTISPKVLTEVEF